MNTTTKHTPGPWFIEHAPNIPGVPMRGPKGTDGADTTEIRSGFVNARERPLVFTGAYLPSAADAALIAAAPELLDALKVAYEYLLDNPHSQGTEYMRQIVAAIARAEGR